jgi:tetratricopeptide (TPR) repeat protein
MPRLVGMMSGMAGKSRKSWVALAVLLAAPIAPLHAATSLAADAPQQGQPPGLESGMRALTDGDLFRAATIFNAMLQKNPHTPEPYIGLAEVQTRSGHADEADQWLARGVIANPKDADLLRARSRIALAQRRFGDAAGLLEKASLLDPADTTDRAMLAKLYAEPLHDPARALPHFKVALTRAPQDAVLHYDYAVALAKLGRDGEALQELTQAQRLGPDNPLPSFLAAQIQAERGASGDALAMLDAVLKIKPDFEAARMARGDILLRAGRYGESTGAYRDFLQHSPRSVLGLTGLAMACQALGQAGEAMRAFKAVIALDPDNIVALNNLAAMSADRKQNLDQAASWATHALAQSKDDSALHDTLGWVYRQSGKPELARAELREGLRLRPSAGLYYHLGMVAADLGKTDAAEQLLQKALLLQPWRADAQTALWTLAEPRPGRKVVQD